MVSASLKLGFLLLTAAVAGNEVVLKRTAKVDDTASYRFVVSATIQGQDVELNMLRTVKVTEVDQGGVITARVGTKSFEFMVGGQSAAIDPFPDATVKYSAANAIMEFVPDSVEEHTPFFEALSLVQLPNGPVKVGTTWDSESTATDFPTIKGKYTVEAEEKVKDFDTLKIKVNGSATTPEATVRNEGYAWVDVKTGWLVKADLKWIDYPIPGQPADVTVKITRE